MEVKLYGNLIESEINGKDQLIIKFCVGLLSIF